MTAGWQVWALGSAAFAALTAVFGKIGVAGIDSTLATLVRTIVILVMLAGIVAVSGQIRTVVTIPQQSWLFLVLSGLATGASWLCYYRALQIGQASQVAPVDKLSVVLVAIFGVAFLGERLAPKDWLGVALIAGGAVLLALRR